MVYAVLPNQLIARPMMVTGMLSVPRKSGPLSTVAYVHGTSVSFYDVPSNPNTLGNIEARGESFEGPPSTAVFAGNSFLYIAPDDLGLGDSTVPRQRYFHAETEASAFPRKQRTKELVRREERLQDALTSMRNNLFFR